MQWIQNRMRRSEDQGFTLIELMVVVLIIAILIAIAIPTFLGARKRAQDRAAQSSARNSFTAAKTIFTDTESYTDVTQTKLEESEPSLTFVSSSTQSDDQNEVSWNAVDANTFRVAVYSKSGKCFHMKDVSGPTTATDLGTTYGYEDVGTTYSSCTAGRADSNFDNSGNAFAANGWTT